jgi:hypothetical protein
MVARGWVDQTLVVDTLSEAALASGLDPDEVQATLASGLTAGLHHPAEDLADRPQQRTSRARDYCSSQNPALSGTQDENAQGLSDCDLADLMAERHADALRYVAVWGKWLHYT